MTWVRLDDSMPEHEKIAALTDRAFRAHVEAICYAARNLTDGRLLAAIVRKNGWQPSTSALVAAGLWERIEGGWHIHDYLDYNPSRDEVERERDSRRAGGRARAAAAGRSGGRFVPAKQPASDQQAAGGLLGGLHQPRPDPDPDPDPVREIAREAYEPPSGLPDLSPDERQRMIAMHSAFTARIGGYPDAWAGASLIKRGATATDIEYAVAQTLANAKGRRKWPYFEACVMGRVEEREAGNDPDERAGSGPRTAGGQPHGRAARARGVARGGNGRDPDAPRSEYADDF